VKVATQASKESTRSDEMTADMKGSSRQALTALRGVAGTPSASDAAKISQDLFSAIAVLDSSLPLRRAVTDPTRESASKTTLIDDLFAKSLAPASLAILKSGATDRWSSPSDFLAALEVIAIEVEAGGADGLDVELMAIAHALSGAKELSGVLMGGLAIDTLVSDLFSSKVSAASLRIALSIARHLRGRHFVAALEESANVAGARRKKIVVHVRSAITLTSAQIDRLHAALGKELNREVSLDLTIDASIIGGIEIQFDDDMVDGTIARRLTEAGRRLAS
jgi:F-type H+-transporting ATPase subunit delta